MGTATHQLYLGLNDPPDFAAALADNSFNPDTLLPGQTYYWRVDEVNANGTTQGQVWSFSTRPVLPDQLVGHWEFETSSSAIDSSEFSNHGEYYNFTAASFLWNGTIYKALSFNGLDQYVRIPHSYEFDFESGDFSVAFWLQQYSYQLDTTKVYSYLMKGSLYESPELDRSGKRYEIYYNPLVYKLRFEIDDNITMSRVEAEGEQFYIRGKWVHLVAIRNTKSGTINLYADGSLVASAEDNTADISQDEDLYFGYNIDNDMYLRGALDDVRLYNYALSDNEIDSLYKLGILTKNIPVYGNNNLSIYPNPAGNIIYLKFKLKDDNDFTVNIYSLSGQVIRSIKMNDQPASGIMEIIADDLMPGIYFVRFINDTNIITKKICINH